MSETAVSPAVAGTPNLADVIVRLDRLEAALLQLIEVVRPAGRMVAAEAPRVAAPAAPQIMVAPPSVAIAPGVAAAGEPPLIAVAPPVPRAGAVPVAAAAVGGDPLAAPIKPYDPYAHRTDIDVPGPTATIQQVLRRVFEAGLTPEPEDTWAIMTKLTHPSQMVGPRALDHFKAFNWHKLRRTAPTYLQNSDPSTFVIAYTDPGEVTPDVDRVRVFVRSGDNRMPVPVGFARDVTNQNAWRVTMMSL
jgi:hypothetical protein